MDRLKWQVQGAVEHRGHTIPMADDLHPQHNNAFRIRKDSAFKSRLKLLVWPAFRLFNFLLVDGYVERTIGNWIRRYYNTGMTYLEFGCGDTRLRRYLPRDAWYNALDVSYSAVQLDRALRWPKMNLALASATDVPLPGNSVDLLVSTETLEHIPDVARALSEARRLVKPGGHFLISIPNNHSYKYAVKGKNPTHVNEWTFNEFVDVLEAAGFKLVEGLMKGIWIPIKTRRSYKIPMSARRECMNVTFLFVFVRKSDC